MSYVQFSVGFAGVPSNERCYNPYMSVTETFDSLKDKCEHLQNIVDYANMREVLRNYLAKCQYAIVTVSKEGSYENLVFNGKFKEAQEKYYGTRGTKKGVFFVSYDGYGPQENYAYLSQQLIGVLKDANTLEKLKEMKINLENLIDSIDEKFKV